MSQEIYQDIILSHYRNPMRKKALDYENPVFSINNPNCGDLIKLQVEGDGDLSAVSISHDAQGCAVSVASCSIMCESLSGKPVDKVREDVDLFLCQLEGEGDISDTGDDIEIESLLFFRNVPARKLCASLAWKCLQKALATLE